MNAYVVLVTTAMVLFTLCIKTIDAKNFVKCFPIMIRNAMLRSCGGLGSCKKKNHTYLRRYGNLKLMECLLLVIG